MKLTLPRRKFLESLGAGAVGAAALGLPARAEVSASSQKLPRLLPGCCAYSYKDYLNLKHPAMTLEDFIRKATGLRLIAVDMTAYYMQSTDPAYLASLRHLAYKHAVAFSGAACGVRMVNAGADARKQALKQIKSWVDVADRLGAPHLRVFAGKLPPGRTLREAVGWVVETMKAACDYSGERGIMIGVEDHEGITQNAEVCLEIMHRVNLPYAGINLDITHFMPTPTLDRYAQIKMCIPYATNTHIRDEFDDRTPIDMDRVWRMFAEAGFQGYMSVEYEKELFHGEDAMTGVPNLVAEVRRLCKKYSSV